MNNYEELTDYLYIAVKKLTHIITHKQSLNTTIVGELKEAKEQIDKANDVIVRTDYPDLKIINEIEYANEDINFMLIDEFYNKTNDLLQETKKANDFFCKLLLYI